MNWRAYWDRQATEADTQVQVARTLEARPLSEAVLHDIAAHITQLLDLQPTDRLLDLCCGNGTLTECVASRCSTAVGLDLSAQQIARAEALFPASSVAYRVGDAAALPPDLRGPFDKINLYFSFQYLDRPGQAAAALAGMVARLAPGGRILLGDVPDQALLHRFYPSRAARWRYRLNRLLGRSLMGKFWAEEELQRIIRPLGLTMEALAQPTHLPYAHYRRDFLLQKIGDNNKAPGPE